MHFIKLKIIKHRITSKNICWQDRL